MVDADAVATKRRSNPRVEESGGASCAVAARGTEGGKRRGGIIPGMRRGLGWSAQKVEGCQKENGAEAAATTTRYATAAHLAHHVPGKNYVLLSRDFANETRDHN